MQRAAASYLGGAISGLEAVGGFGGKAVTLAEGALYSNDPGYYKIELDRMAKATPEQVKAAAQKWLSRPAFSLTVHPRRAHRRRRESRRRGHGRQGDRGGRTRSLLERGAWRRRPGCWSWWARRCGGVDRRSSQLPAVADLKALDFPAIERTRLKNGIEVVFARRTTVPTVNVAVSFDAGYAADPHERSAPNR